MEPLIAGGNEQKQQIYTTLGENERVEATKINKKSFHIEQSSYPTNQAIFPSKGVGCCDGCQAEPHTKSWFISIILWFLIAVQITCFIGFSSFCNDNPDPYSYYNCVFPCVWTYELWYAWLIPFILFLILYLIESGCSHSIRYLKNCDIQEGIYQYIGRLQSYPPKICWHVDCYHYETRTRTVSSTDSKGNTTYTTETYTETVYTHSADTTYQYNTWNDISQDTKELCLDEYKLTKIKYSKTFEFGNNETEQDYESKKEEFKRVNDLDTHQSFSATLKIQDFTDKMLSEVQPGTKSKYLSPCYFWVFTLLLLSVCYRHWFSSIVGRKKYKFIKQISI